MALVAPWLVALALGGTALLTGPSTPTRPGPPAAADELPTARADGAAAPVRRGPADDSDLPDPGVPATVADGVDLDPATTARVLAAARTALGTHGLTTSVAGAADRWVLDQLAADPVPTGDAAVVVVVHATVITRGTTGEWSGPTVAAAAVPVRLGPPVEVGPAAEIGRARPDGAATDAPARHDARGDAAAPGPSAADATDHTEPTTTPRPPARIPENQ